MGGHLHHPPPAPRKLRSLANVERHLIKTINSCIIANFVDRPHDHQFVKTIIMLQLPCNMSVSSNLLAWVGNVVQQCLIAGHCSMQPFLLLHTTKEFVHWCTWLATTKWLNIAMFDEVNTYATQIFFKPVLNFIFAIPNTTVYAISCYSYHKIPAMLLTSQYPQQTISQLSWQMLLREWVWMNLETIWQ